MNNLVQKLLCNCLCEQMHEQFNEEMIFPSLHRLYSQAPVWGQQSSVFWGLPVG